MIDDNDKRFDSITEYIRAYSEHTDQNVLKDPSEAIGGMWDEIGRHQFEYLVSQGLQPRHSMLDIGCGTLRGGRHFIRYLAEERYTGIDISPEAINYGRKLVIEENIENKQPRLLVSEKRDLKFVEFTGETFDFILAQSVLTHLMPPHIEECFRHIGRIMGPDSVFFFTFYNNEKMGRMGLTTFAYPVEALARLAGMFGLSLIDRSADYRHPRKQSMAEVRKRL